MATSKAHESFGKNLPSSSDLPGGPLAEALAADVESLNRLLHEEPGGQGAGGQGAGEKADEIGRSLGRVLHDAHRLVDSGVLSLTAIEMGVIDGANTLWRFLRSREQMAELQALEATGFSAPSPHPGQGRACRVRSVIDRHLADFDFGPRAIRDDTTFDDIGADSLDCVQIVMEIEADLEVPAHLSIIGAPGQGKAGVQGERDGHRLLVTPRLTIGDLITHFAGLPIAI